MRSLVLFLALAPLAAAQAPSAARPEVARLEVRAGRAVVRTSPGDSTTIRRDQVRNIAGPAHLEIAAGAHVRLSWIGRASLEVYGPAALQWDLLPEPEAAPQAMGTYSTRGLEVSFFDVAWADFESRRGAHVLRLPSDWRLDCGAGAWHLRGLPAGPLELHQHAGRAARLTWLGDANAARPPLALYPGSSIRLDRIRESRPGATEDGLQAWEDPAWPWRETNDDPADRAERERLAAETDRMPGFPTRDPAAEGPRASIKGVAQSGELRVVVTPGDESESGPAAGRRGGASSVATQRPRPETEPRLGGTPVPRASEPSRRAARERGDSKPSETTPTAPESTSRDRAETGPAGTYRAEDWRGVARERLEVVGSVLVEESPGTEVRVFASGRFKVLVDPSAERGSWVFSPTADFRLSVGAVLMFDPDGDVVLRFGEIEELPPQPRAGDPRR